MKSLRNVMLAGSALALAACADQGPTATSPRTAAPVVAARGVAVEGSYVVVVKEGADPRSVAAIAGVNPHFVYTAAVNGFSAELNQGQLNALQHNPSVDYIEQDQVYTATTTQSGATWGIDRIDQRSRPLSGTYTYTTTASNVRAYIIDTGIQANHPQFGSRAAPTATGTGRTWPAPSGRRRTVWPRACCCAACACWTATAAAAPAPSSRGSTGCA